jgi:hypothetical protein
MITEASLKPTEGDTFLQKKNQSRTDLLFNVHLCLISFHKIHGSETNLKDSYLEHVSHRLES